MVRIACIAAGLLWIRCALVGAAAGAVLGLVCGRLASLAAVATTGAYVLALRGAWGLDRLGGTRADLGAASIVVPVVMALGVTVALALRSRRDAEPDASLVALHVGLSFTAAHLTLQLPYYRGLMPAFLGGLGAPVRLVLPWRA